MIRANCVVRPLPLALAAVLLTSHAASAFDNEAKAKYTIREVMITAYKEKLAKRVIRGEASEQEKQKLLKMYQALADTQPPRGSTASWRRKTYALVEAAEAAVEGEHNAPLLLKKTMECGGCHSTHK